MAVQNENREIAIKVSGVKKRYKLGQIGGGTLQADLQSWWARVRGKEDPNSKIGVDQRSNGKTFMALNGLDLTVYKGEALGIIGSNGAGKSTLLKLLSRVTAPTEGEIDIYGRIASMLEVGTGFNGEMTGRENIYLNGAILGMTKEEIDAKMEQIIEFSEVREFIDTPVKRYSSGMFVKLAFSVAAHLDSEIMIMDEVLAVGDMAFQQKCLNKMREAANEDGRTVLYVSHNMNTIRQLCDRCVVLDKGRVVFAGDVEDAIEIYMGTSVVMKNHYEYDSSKHSNKGSKDVYLKSLDIIDNDKVLVNPNSSLIMNLYCNVKKKIENIEFRLEIQFADGTVAGTSMSGNKICLSREGLYKLEIAFDVSHIAPGRYMADLVVFTTDDCGNDYYIDGVFSALCFEIDDGITDTNKHIWLHKYWGHTKYEDLVVTAIERL